MASGANVLLVVIDAASPRVLCPAVQTGRLKHLQRLADAGEMHPASISIFPSITPAATASIITGAYPAEHGIVGASWYDDASGQVAYHGDALWVIADHGFGRVPELPHLSRPQDAQGERSLAAGGTSGDAAHRNRARADDAVPTTWRWDGEPALLRLDADGRCVESSEYPNAFERIAGVLDADAAGDIWLTARPGCEFEVRGGKPHVGGASHGALHALDSLSPVICAGSPMRLPRALRSIDLAAVCLRALGLARPTTSAPREIFPELDN